MADEDVVLKAAEMYRLTNMVIGGTQYSREHRMITVPLILWSVSTAPFLGRRLLEGKRYKTQTANHPIQ